MRQTALLGNADTKRTDYFRQAAKKAGLPICFADWNDWERQWESLTETELFLNLHARTLGTTINETVQTIGS